MRTTVPYLQRKFFAGRFPGVISRPPPGTVGITASFGAVTVNAASATSVTFAITKSLDTILKTVIVTWAVAGTGANPVTGADFAGAVLPSNTLVIPAGTPGALVTIIFAAETPPAADETGRLTLSVVSGAVVDPAASFFDFRVNKAGLNLTVRISSSFDTVDVTAGGTTTKTFVVAKSTDLLQTSVAVPWALTATAGNPVAGSDFVGGVLPSGTVTIGAGTPNATVSVVFVAEAPPAVVKTGHVALSAPVGVSVDPTAGSFDFQVNASGATGLVGISSSFATVDVPPTGTVTASFVASKSPDILNSAVTVPWAINGIGVDPVTGLDFQSGVLPSGTISLPIGVGSATVTVTFVAEPPPVRLYSDTVAWNVPAAGLPTATAATNQGLDSATLVSRLLAASPFLKCTVDTNTFPVFVATAATPLATLAITDVPGGSVPQGTQVPWNPPWVPSGGQWDGSANKDAQAVILIPATGKEYDLWQVSYNVATNVLSCTHAHQSTDSYLTGLGVRAKARSCGLLYGAMTLLARELAWPDDIRHALSLGIPNEHSSIFFAPAVATDGGIFGVATGVPTGTRFVLSVTDAQIDAFVAAYPPALTPGMVAAGRKLLRCLRDYGFFVTDNAGAAHFWFEDVNSGAAIYNAAGLTSVNVSGVPYPSRLLQGLFTTANLRAVVPSDQYP